MHLILPTVIGSPRPRDHLIISPPLDLLHSPLAALSPYWPCRSFGCRTSKIAVPGLLANQDTLCSGHCGFPKKDPAATCGRLSAISGIHLDVVIPPMFPAYTVEPGLQSSRWSSFRRQNPYPLPVPLFSPPQLLIERSAARYAGPGAVSAQCLPRSRPARWWGETASIRCTGCTSAGSRRASRTRARRSKPPGRLPIGNWDAQRSIRCGLVEQSS